MKKLLLTVVVLASMLKGYAESQVVYFPAHFKVPTEVKVFVDRIIKKACKDAISRSDIIRLVHFEVEYDEYDQGKVDTYYKISLDVDYNTNDDDSDSIDLIVEDYDINNPQFPRFYLEGLKSTGGVCRD